MAGFGTILIDYRIGIAIRQLTAGVLELFVLFPLLAVFGGADIVALIEAALTSPALVVFAVSGFFAMPAFSFWYKGNSMCGTALGMACNGMYAFWGPFFIWVIMGALGIGGLSASYPPLSAVQWIGAVVMVAGIFCIAVNPFNLFFGKEREAFAMKDNRMPLHYAIMMHFLDGREDCAEGVVEALTPEYGGYKAYLLVLRLRKRWRRRKRMGFLRRPDTA